MKAGGAPLEGRFGPPPGVEEVTTSPAKEDGHDSLEIRTWGLCLKDISSW